MAHVQNSARGCLPKSLLKVCRRDLCRQPRAEFCTVKWVFNYRSSCILDHPCATRATCKTSADHAIIYISTSYATLHPWSAWPRITNWCINRSRKHQTAEGDHWDRFLNWIMLMKRAQNWNVETPEHLLSFPGGTLTLKSRSVNVRLLVWIEDSALRSAAKQPFDGLVSSNRTCSAFYSTWNWVAGRVGEIDAGIANWDFNEFHASCAINNGSWTRSVRSVLQIFWTY